MIKIAKPYTITSYYSKSEIDSRTSKEIINLKNKLICHNHNIAINNNLSNKPYLIDYHTFCTEKDSVIFCIYHKKSVIGYLEFSIDDTKIVNSKNITTITGIWVEPQYRRRGIASKLVRELYNQRSGSVYQITFCDYDSVALNFLKHVGFVNKIQTTYSLDWNDEDDNID